MSLVALTEDLRTAIQAAAQQAYPKECCGLIVVVGGAPRYWPCANIAPAGQVADRFVLDPHDYAAAEDAGNIAAVVHSHPDASANPSAADRIGCERSGLPWFIVGWPSGVIVEVQPTGWRAPLVGREFVFGVLDCYTLVRDYYQETLNVELPDFEREDGFWKKTRREDGSWRPGQDLYLDNFRAAGFEVASGPLQLHDVVLMQVQSDVANHAAIYVGDGVILHHLYGRLSCNDVYGGYWQRVTRMVVRHKSLMRAKA